MIINEIWVGADSKFAERELASRELHLRLGLATLTIYLNGGSEERRTMREYWSDYARNLNVEFESSGSHCVIGSRR